MHESVSIDRDYAIGFTGSGRRHGIAEESRSGGRSPAAVALLCLSLVALAALAAVFAVAPTMRVSGMVVSGNASVGADEIRAWAGVGEDSFWFSVRCDVIEANVRANPRIRTALARKSFPNGISVTVTERIPVAQVVAEYDGRSMTHCVDGEGYVFAPSRDYPDALSLPVVSGLDIRSLRYGARLDGAFREFLGSLEAIRASNPSLLSVISEAKLVARASGAFDVVLFPVHYRLPVLVRPSLNESLLESIMVVLDVVEGKGIASSIRELDFRTGTYVYRIKEAPPG